MKKFLFLWGVAVAVASAIAATVAPRASYVTTSGREFNIDGTIGYFMGTNTYWIGFLTNNDDIDLVMKDVAAVGRPTIHANIRNY